MANLNGYGVYLNNIERQIAEENMRKEERKQ